MSFLLSCKGLNKAFGPRNLFQDLALSFNEEERIGLIGPNGSGKSTFLKILAGEEPADSGEIVRRRDLRLAWVPQVDIFPAGATVQGLLVETLNQDHLEEHDIQTRVATMLTRLEFTDPNQSVETLSGGWRKRLAIARALITEPELVLMDEPTNHLDLEGIMWLEKLLKNARFACLVVSHDRYFLDNMTTRIVELDKVYPEGFLSISGTYSEFLVRREEFLAIQNARQESMDNLARREIDWLAKGPKARRTKAQYRINEAEKLLEDLAQVKARNASADQKVAMEFSATERKTNKLLAAHNLKIQRGGRVLFSGLNLTLSPGRVVGLLGKNGSGKTSLLQMLAGNLEPDAGTIKRASELRIVYFDQARAQLQKQLTLREALSPQGDTVIYQDQPIHVTSWARRFLFRYEQLGLTVNMLSGGEQARILVAQLMLRPADLLILDEPTNDLDIPSLQVLEEAIEEFPGAVLLVTHDRYMLERLSSELLHLDGQGGWHVFASLEQWQNAQEKARLAAVAQAREAARPAALEAAKPATPSRKRLSFSEQREFEAMEAKILQAEEDVTQLQTRVDGLLGSRETLQLRDACVKLQEAQELVHKLYARWQELE